MRRRFERWDPRNFDRYMWGVFVTGLTIAFMIALPRVYPPGREGVSCTDMAHPIGGNNRSALGQKGDMATALDIELDIADQNLIPGENLTVQVTFVNQHFGAVILWLPPESPLLSFTDVNGNPVPGLSFQIRSLSTDTLAVDQGAAPSVAGPYDYGELYVLGSHSRCTQTFTISSQRLTQVLGPSPSNLGQYYLRAQYFIPANSDPLPPSPQPPLPTATATAAWLDVGQGVWEGLIESRRGFFALVPQPTPAPALPPG